MCHSIDKVRNNASRSFCCNVPHCGVTQYVAYSTPRLQLTQLWFRSCTYVWFTQLSFNMVHVIFQPRILISRTKHMQYSWPHKIKFSDIELPRKETLSFYISHSFRWFYKGMVYLLPMHYGAVSKTVIWLKPICFAFMSTHLVGIVEWAQRGAKGGLW